MFYKRKLDWYVGYLRSEKETPLKRVLATVPGAVQLDWANAEGWGDYWYSNNYKDYLWMEDVFWSYSAILELPDHEEDECVFFVCKGIDYKFMIKLNGIPIYEQEGMFTPFEINLSDKAVSGDELEIIIFPVPKREGALTDRSQADQCCKPAVSYGWDFHPRLVPSGIWDEAYLEVRSVRHMVKSETFYTLNEDFSKAYIKQNIMLNKQCEGSIRWKLYGCDGKIITQLEHLMLSNEVFLTLEYTLDSPCLWWPSGQGEANLYRSVTELFNSGGIIKQSVENRVGLRKIRLIMHPGGWDKPSEFPKSRSNPPIALEMNGRQIFCKGSNWAPAGIFPGETTDDDYRRLVIMAREANMNIFRCWGGGIINKDVFFDLCDENGIMVWQEFPLACNNYEGTPQYLRILDQESRSIIKRIRSHPCLVMWCGGNELFNSWSRMTDQSLALRLLNRNCYDLDPKTPFIMTSPLSGMSHGNYLFRYEMGEEVFQVMPRSSSTAYTEFGCPSPAAGDYLKKFIPRENLFPPKPGTAWESHHAMNAWTDDTWLCLKTIERYFGRSKTLEELVERGQLLQSEGYKCIFEEARRQKPVCSMALNWCFNEPWPTAANNSIISWPAEAKPAYFAIKASLRPVLASARISKFSWCEGDIFDPEIWILNDSPHKFELVKIKVYLQFRDSFQLLLEWDCIGIDPNKNISGPRIRYPLKYNDSGKMKLVLKADGFSEMDSEYELLYKSQRHFNMFDEEEHNKIMQ